MKTSLLILLLHFFISLSSPAPVEDILPQATGPRKWNQTRVELLKTFIQQVQINQTCFYTFRII